MIRFLIVALTISSFVGAEERKSGRDLHIKMRDDRTVEGELVAVDGDRLILWDNSSFVAIEVQIEEVGHIRVLKESKSLKGVGLGFLLGSTSGVVIGLMSGDDTEGFFQFTASEKARIFGLALGIVGAPIGGIVGAIAGIDESVVVTSASTDEKILILRKLRSHARYVDEIPQNIKISPPAPTMESAEANSMETHPLSMFQSRNDVEPSLTSEIINRIHVSIAPGYYVSPGMGDLTGLLATIGFNRSKHYSYGLFWPEGSFRVAYPRKVKSPRSDIDVKLEYSLNKNLAFGVAYSPLRKHGATGRRVITDKDYRESVEVETFITGSIAGMVTF